jgi:hypothetical protein
LTCSPPARDTRRRRRRSPRDVDELLNFAWLDNDELLRLEGEIRNALAVALDDGDDALVEVVNFWSGLTRRRREACEPPRS